MATCQLAEQGDVDFIVYDYLAEVTMSIMARARTQSPEQGYASDFVTAALAPNLKTIADKGIRIVSNAGGVNPLACGDAVQALINQHNLDLTVAVVTGDDLIAEREAFSEYREMFTDQSFPPTDRIASINAYLGAFPIAEALNRGADIVITGRCVDSAVTLGACIHHFGWSATAFDQLAAGSIAGHILECGPQATGGNFTDWLSIADSMHNIGYPIAEVSDDGVFTIGKPKDTGGVVNRGTVAEQLLYEVGDPQGYTLPDVICDFSEVAITEIDRDLVRVSGCRGYAPPSDYKVSATWHDGFRGGQTLLFYGDQASDKARLFAEATLKRAEKGLHASDLPPFDQTLIELIGDESHYGAARKMKSAREVQLKVAARHASPKGIGILLKETIGAALAGPPSLTSFAGGRPKPSPVVRLFSFLIPKPDVLPMVHINGDQFRCELRDANGEFSVTPHKAPAITDPDMPTTPVRLIQIAWGRSGDKGDKANIGIIARRPEYLPYIWQDLTPERVQSRFAHFTDQPVDRYLAPGFSAINFVLHDVLGGGGIASLRNDPQGKGYAQLLLDIEVELPIAMVEELEHGHF